MATWSSAYIKALPDSAFACPDERAYPHHNAEGDLDLPHLRAALSRVGDSSNTQCGKAHLRAHAEAEGMGKAAELKAEPMTTSQLDRWLSGKIPRRALVVPFGGPIKAKDAPLGVDLDGEWFDSDTDLYGPYPTLRKSRERLVDWHHLAFWPAGTNKPEAAPMKGAIMGHIVMDEEPEPDGLWADFWANAGEERRMLIAALERRAVPLYGSTQPIFAGVRKADTGHIEVWPVRYHTITTSPQNTFAVVPPLKATLSSLDELPAEALKAYLTGLDAEALDLLVTSAGAAASPSAQPGEPAATKPRVSSETLAALAAAFKRI